MLFVPVGFNRSGTAPPPPAPTQVVYFLSSGAVVIVDVGAPAFLNDGAIVNG